MMNVMIHQYTSSSSRYGIQLFRTLIKNCNNITKTKSQYCTAKVYNEKQEEKILMVLNNSTEEDLSRLLLAKRRVSKVCEFIEQNGKFESLQQFHHLLNLKEKTLIKVCDTILGDKKGVTTNFCTSNITVGNEPASERLSILPSVVGVSIGMDSSFSYAEITTEFELKEWGHISPPEITTKKTNPLTIYDTVKEACNKLPIRDAYVLESMSSLLPQQTFLQSFLLKREIQAMLIALLNSRLPQQHRVYFLRSRIISRLYKIQVGSERVSSQPLVEQLLNGQGIGPDNTSKLKSVEPELEAVYRSQTGNQKEAKANALLLGIAFLKLAVHGDLVCHQALKVR